MGLDVVELVMEVEDAFDISIPDDDFEEIMTVGDLHDYIVKRRCVEDPDRNEPTRPNVCLTAMAFVRIRSVLVSKLGIERSTIRPETGITDMLPRSNRRLQWRQLQDALPWNLPALVRPEWLVWILVIAVAATFIIGMRLAARGGHLDWGLFAGSILLVTFLSLFLARLTRRFAVIPRTACATVGGLAHVTVSRNFCALQEQYNGFSTSDIWGALKAIVVDQLDVSPDAVTREAHFVNDLMCG